MKYHPDHNPGDKEAKNKFREANEAYEVPSDTSKRAACDQYGHTGVDPDMGGGAGAGFSRTSFSDIFGDMFSNFFGGGGARGGSRGGVQCDADLRYTLDLDLEEAVCDIAAIIHVPTLVGCKTCNGSDVKPGTTPVACTTCGNIGQVHTQQGLFSIQQICPRCYGAGKTISDPCGSCHGQGRVEEQKTLSTKVLADVDTSDRIRPTDEDEAGSMGGPAGDLYVAVGVRGHPIFQRDDKHLYCEVLISFADAMLGGELEVPTLDGRVKLKTPKSTQIGKLFRLRGKGAAPVRGGGTGDLVYKVMMETSVNLNKRRRELLEEFRKLLQSDTSHSPRTSGWFEDMKRFSGDL